MKNTLEPLATSVLLPLALTTIASLADPRIHKKTQIIDHHINNCKWGNGWYHENIWMSRRI